MEQKKLGPARLVLRADTVVLLPCLAAAVWYDRELYDYMSFGGIEALFLLAFRVPYLWALGGALALALVADRSGRALFAGLSAGLQIIAPIPWFLLIVYGFGGPFSWPETVMALDVLAGAVVLLFLPEWKKES